MRLPIELLRRLAALVERPPAPLPWRLEELSAAELDRRRGLPAPTWDPVEQPSREAFDAGQVRRERTARWRGLVAEDGTPVLGEPLPGGAPRGVVDPAWRLALEAVNALPELLELLRELWRDRQHDRSAPEVAEPVVADDGFTGVTLHHHALAAAAVAAYEAVPSAHRFDELPAHLRDEWLERMGAALAVYVRHPDVSRP